MAPNHRPKEEVAREIVSYLETVAKHSSYSTQRMLDALCYVYGPSIWSQMVYRIGMRLSWPWDWWRTRGS